MVTATDVTKYYGLLRAVDGISFELHKGEVLGFLGPNGAGKTTTMKMLTCYLAPSAGSVKVKGYDVSEDPLRVRSFLGYLPENAPLYPDMTVMGFLRFCAEIRGIGGRERDRRVSRAAEQCGIENRMKDPIAVLSKGLRQRVGLAQAILPDPEMLILDEPTSGLDPVQIVEIRNIIRELGKTKTVILSTHILSEVELTCTRAIIVNDGKVVADADLDELREGAGQGRVYHIDVGRDGAGTDSERAGVLRELPGVEKVETAPRSPDDPWRYLVHAKGDEDLRPKLFQLAVDRKWPLVELHRDISTLEQVFIRLTQPAAHRVESAAAKA
ncbi:MAG: ATP-binding cassette domain-containing protein [Deltaproteobacteria bacterium]|nr:ATP-binding cassette domain-containing protein [Deltaproteobacteria bacterium]